MGNTLPERISQLYYSYGLFSSSYPTIAITTAILAVLVSCYPLLNVPLPGNIPTVVSFPRVNGIFQDANSTAKELYPTEGDISFNLSSLLNSTTQLTYAWANEKPLFYVKQIIVKTGIHPWTDDLTIMDGFRAPLQESFRLSEIIRNHEESESGVNFDNICYRVDSPTKTTCGENCEFLPQYNCLLLSPANLWMQNVHKFNFDNNIVGTMFRFHNVQKGKVSMAEMAFGLPLKDAGIKRYPLRSRPRTLQYAITLILNKADYRYLDSLKRKLIKLYPMEQEQAEILPKETFLIYYPENFNYHELVPLCLSFVGLFFYVYFSVRKIEHVKSKLGLAICAVVTVLGTLSMSAGLCFLFGISFSLQGKEIFPYLVILVGLENVLVLTRSVTSTDARLDVKIRLAQGLSKEGWSITKNLLIEITILNIGLLTFVPFIQEFSIFMIFSLLSDFLIQMLFFATILGIDVRRMEYTQSKKNKIHLQDYFYQNRTFKNRSYNNPDYESRQIGNRKMLRSKSHPRLNGLNHSPTDVVAERKSNCYQNKKVPKRVKVVNIWARTRLFQRAFMMWMVVWISMITYNSDIIQKMLDKPRVAEKKSDGGTIKHEDTKYHSPVPTPPFIFKSNKNEGFVTPAPPLGATSNKTLQSENINLKYYARMQPWKRLSMYHWPSILAYYNTSMAGKYIVVLPPLLLSCRIKPEIAKSVRNLDEKEPVSPRWQALISALDPIEVLPDFEGNSSTIQNGWSKSDLPIYPSTPLELLLLLILCGISVAVIAYTLVVMYRCICSKNYAEWRSSWQSSQAGNINSEEQHGLQLEMEAVPVVIRGHNADIECLVSDGEVVVSCCLQGYIKVWDVHTGHHIITLDRNRNRSNSASIEKRKTYEYESISSSFENELPLPNDNSVVPIIKKDLLKHLSDVKNKKVLNGNVNSLKKTSYEFAKSYSQLYLKETTENNNECEHETETARYTNYKCTRKKRSLTDKRKSSGGEPGLNDSLMFEDKINYTNQSIPNEDMFNLSDECVSEQVVSKSNLFNDCESDNVYYSESPIWCMDFADNLICIGCADGQMEFWDATTSILMCVNRDMCTTEAAQRGVTRIRIVPESHCIVATSLSGRLVLLRLTSSRQSDVGANTSISYRRSHFRSGSTGSMQSKYDAFSAGSKSNNNDSEYWNLFGLPKGEVKCMRIAVQEAHQQVITILEADGGRLVTGSQDHLLKVWSDSDLEPLFTLHGHLGPITSCFIDCVTPSVCGSGSQDGLLCVWDLHTGACLYNMNAHDGAITCLSYTTSYVLSCGSDEKLCVWDRFQGFHLKTIYVGLSYFSTMLPLTHSTLLIGDKNGLTIWNLSTGEIIKKILLGKNDGCVLVKQLLPLKDAIVCDYANQLRIVRFPMVSKMFDAKLD